jgi:hypothetical protein
MSANDTEDERRRLLENLVVRTEDLTSAVENVRAALSKGSSTANTMIAAVTSLCEQHLAVHLALQRIEQAVVAISERIGSVSDEMGLEIKGLRQDVTVLVVAFQATSTPSLHGVATPLPEYATSGPEPRRD